jgi:8-oxo-dGTP pyrophosphatase MutT (NUDIX family)
MPNPPAPRAIQRFEVSLKAFVVRDDGRALFVCESDTGYWELPGGRIDVGEEWIGHKAILAREITEELGPGLSISVSEEAVTWTRQRPTDHVFQFIVGRVCRLHGGALQLSDEHAQMAWLDAAEARDLGFPPLSDYQQALESLWRLASRIR